jgi:hypothetical protein
LVVFLLRSSLNRCNLVASSGRRGLTTTGRIPTTNMHSLHRPGCDRLLEDVRPEFQGSNNLVPDAQVPGSRDNKARWGAVATSDTRVTELYESMPQHPKTSSLCTPWSHRVPRHHAP